MKVTTTEAIEMLTKWRDEVGEEMMSVPTMVMEFGSAREKERYSAEREIIGRLPKAKIEVGHKVNEVFFDTVWPDVLRRLSKADSIQSDDVSIIVKRQEERGGLEKRVGRLELLVAEGLLSVNEYRTLMAARVP